MHGVEPDTGLPPGVVRFRTREVPGAAAATTGAPAELVSGWDLVRERLVARWPVVTIEELDATRGRPELLAALLQAKVGYAQRLVVESCDEKRERPARSRLVGARRLLGALGLLGLSGYAFLGVLMAG